jgi:DNA-binding NtrC family response regulator
MAMVQTFEPALAARPRPQHYLPVEEAPPGILVIDDDGPIRLVLGAALRRRGFAVWLAADATQALAQYRVAGSSIDLVLSDVGLPDLRGPELIGRLLQLNPDLRFCFMTGELSAPVREELDACGASWVFPKPFPLREVVEGLWRLARGAPARTD